MKTTIKISRQNKSQSFLIAAIGCTLLVLLFPWDIITPSLTGGGSFFELRALAYILIGALWVGYLASGKVPVSKPRVFVYAIACFLGISALSLTSRLNVYAGIEGILLFLSYFAIFFLVALNTNGAGERLRLVNALIMGSTFLALYAIYQRIWGFQALIQHNPGMGGIPIGTRVYAVFTSPNLLAIVLVMAIPFSLLAVLSARTVQTRILYLASLSAMLMALYLTYSRGGYLVFVLAICLFGWLLVRELGTARFKVLTTYLLAGLIVLTILLFFVSQIVTPGGAYSGLTLTAALNSLLGRQQFWLAALEIIKTHPVLGTGLNSFAVALPAYQYQSFYSKFAHNSYLQVAAETGVFGAIALLLILGFVWIQGNSLRKSQSREDRLFGIAFLSSATAFLVHNLFDYSLYILIPGLIFWTLAGLTLSGLMKSKEVKNRALFMLAPGLWLIVVFVLTAGYSLAETGKSLLPAGGPKAVSSLKTATAFVPFSSEYHSLLANAYRNQSVSGDNRMDSLNLALQQAQKAVLYEPATATYAANLGFLYLETGNRDEGYRWLNKAIDLYPNEPIYPYLLGLAHEREKEPRAAAKAYEKALGLLPFYKIKFSENVSYRPQGLDSITALEEAHLALSDAYLTLDRKREAVSLLASLIQARPWNPTAHYRLAKAYQSVGELEKARQETDKALQLRPDLEEAKSLLSTLRNIKK